MNKTRRKTLTEIIERLWEIKEEIEAIQAEEQEAFDALPESLQAATNGEKMKDCISAIEDGVSALSETIGYLTSCLE